MAQDCGLLGQYFASTLSSNRQGTILFGHRDLGQLLAFYTTLHFLRVLFSLGIFFFSIPFLSSKHQITVDRARSSPSRGQAAAHGYTLLISRQFSSGQTKVFIRFFLPSASGNALSAGWDRKRLHVKGAEKKKMPRENKTRKKCKVV